MPAIPYTMFLDTWLLLSTEKTFKCNLLIHGTSMQIMFFEKHLKAMNFLREKNISIESLSMLSKSAIQNGGLNKGHVVLWRYKSSTGMRCHDYSGLLESWDPSGIAVNTMSSCLSNDCILIGSLWELNSPDRNWERLSYRRSFDEPSLPYHFEW